jgi:transposase
MAADCWGGLRERQGMLSIHEIRAIHQRGVYAVAQTISDLYEMIEMDDARVQKLIRRANATYLQKIKHLTGRINQLEGELLQQKRRLYQQARQIKDLSKQLREAQEQTRRAREAHLATVMKDSQNSSQPPSTDIHKKTRSLREKSGRLPGGQLGHPGATLKFVSQPDHLITHAPEACHLCGSSFSESAVTRSERRQVHELPPPKKLEVTEHLVQTKVCGRCGAQTKATFPAGVNAPVQYGKRVRAVCAYLLGYQLLPFERCAEALDDLFHCRLSRGTLATILQKGASELVEAELLIKQGLRKSAVIGVDETNLRVRQKQDWVHVSSTPRLTLLVHDCRRGAAAISEIDILPRYTGTALHDGFTAYERYDQCAHALCNAHILRELNYVRETSKPEWAKEMKDLLLEIKAAVVQAQAAGLKNLGPRERRKFSEDYDEVLAKAGKQQKRAKKVAESEAPFAAAARKLANRLIKKKEQVLLFMQDFRVAFDNNQAERDLRMFKVKQKISGCFRTDRGVREFCRLRSYLSTMKKQNKEALAAVQSIYSGRAILPLLE